MDSNEKEPNTAGRKKRQSPPYEFTEQLVRTALNQGMTPTEIAKLCRIKDKSLVSKWKTRGIRAQTHVIEPLIKLFGHMVHRHQLHHFSHVDPKDFGQCKLTEVRGSLIFSWEIREVYDVDERSLMSKRRKENFKVPRLREFVTAKIYIFHRKPNRFVVVKTKPFKPVSTFRDSEKDNAVFRKAHVSAQLPDVLEIVESTDAQEVLQMTQDFLARLRQYGFIWFSCEDPNNYQAMGSYLSIGESFIFLKAFETNTSGYSSDSSPITDYFAPIGMSYIKQHQDALKALYRQFRLNGFINSGEFAGHEVEVI